MSRSVEVGDVITWKGPRNYGYREIAGRVRHVGKLFVRAGPMVGSNQDTFVRHSQILTVRKDR